MKTIDVVIGAGFGDEGKGLVTDHLVNKYKGGRILNIRFNGGAQASHTVWLDENTRHAFQHFGAGTFRGATTYLTRDFILNPLMYVKERNKLTKLMNSRLSVWAHVDCKVTTIHDIMYNRYVERRNKFGSCGLGINATVDRHEHFPITFETKYDELVYLMKETDEYYKKSIGNIYDGLTEYEKDALIDSYLQAFYWMTQEPDYKIKKISDNDTGDGVAESSIPEFFDHLVFEGAQGLELDEHWGKFPHVTRSRTGSINIISNNNFQNFIRKTDSVNWWYVTRAYKTRHGAGPFLEDVEVQKDFNITDETNIDNEWQGSMRFGALNTDTLGQFILKDMECTKELGVKNNLVMTCLDQLQTNEIRIITSMKHIKNSIRNFPYTTSLENVLHDINVMVDRNISTMYGSYNKFGTDIRKLRG